jgi:adenylate cyclase
VILRRWFGEGPTIREALENDGLDPEQITRAEADGTLPLVAVERLVIADEPKYTVREAAAQTNRPEEEIAHFWRALGFPDPHEDDRVFTEHDLDMLKTAALIIEEHVVDPEVALQMARVIGSALSRVASAQVSALADRALSEAGQPVGEEPLELRASVLLEAMPEIIEYVWRRHLQDEARRRILQVGAGGDTPVAIGFADLVGFTALSQQVPDDELARVVARFESVAYDIVHARGGRVIKMIGDEVMFMVDDPRAAAEIALDLAETYRHDEALSDVRVGLARGAVIEQDGDVFGPVVNLAHRIVSIAYPGSVVVSPDIHAALEDDESFDFRSLRSHTLKDIGRVKLWRMRRRADAEPGSLLEKARLRREVGREWIEEHFGNLVPDPDRESDEPVE